MDSRVSVELYLGGKKIKINVACMNESAQMEIESFLTRPNLDIKDILKAYIQKAQDYAELQDKITDLVIKLETS